MSVNSYSTNAASNTSAPPNGAPEGMQASQVNDTMRQMMADTKSMQNALSGYLFGLTLSNDGTTPATALDIAAGSAQSSDSTYLMVLASAVTKTTGAWAVGSGNGALDTGSVAASTWYHVFVIARPDTGVVDVLFSTSPTAPTMPANYTVKRRIGSFKTDGSAHILAFVQRGDVFQWAAPVRDLSAGTMSLSPLDRLLPSLPTGVPIVALLSAIITDTTAADVFLYDPALGSLQAGTTNLTALSANGSIVITVQIPTANASIRTSSTNGTTALSINTLGWTDFRGRLV